jgi:hypothetical protein
VEIDATADAAACDDDDDDDDVSDVDGDDNSRLVSRDDGVAAAIG